MRLLQVMDALQPRSVFGPDFTAAAVFRLTGPIRPAVLQAALDDLVRWHAALRTEIVMRPPHQWITPARPAGFIMTRLATADHAQVMRFVADRPAGAPPGPPQPPLWAHLGMLGTGDDDAVLMLGVHHATADGFSLELLMRDLVTAYASRLESAAPSAPPGPTYAELAAQSRSPQAEERIRAALDYWRQRLSGLSTTGTATDPATNPTAANPATANPAVTPALTSAGGTAVTPVLTPAGGTVVNPTDGIANGTADGAHSGDPTGVQRSGVYDRLGWSMDGARLVKAARAANTTPFVVLLAALVVALHRHYGATDLVIPVLTSGPRTAGVFGRRLVSQPRAGTRRAFPPPLPRRDRRCDASRVRHRAPARGPRHPPVRASGWIIHDTGLLRPETARALVASIMDFVEQQL